MTTKTAVEKERVRKDAEATAGDAARRREGERRRRARDPKAIAKAEAGREPSETRVAKTWSRVLDETEGERRGRLMTALDHPDDFVPPRRALVDDELDEEVAEEEIERAAPPLHIRKDGT